MRAELALRCAVISYPTAECTIQQLDEAIPSDHEYRFLIHDRHAMFSSELDAAHERSSSFSFE